MKKYSPWVLLFIVVVLAIWYCTSTDARVAAIVEQSDQDLAISAKRIGELQTRLAESSRRYADTRGEVERLEGLLQARPKVVTKVVIKEVPAGAPSPPSGTVSQNSETLLTNDETLLTNDETFSTGIDWESVFWAYYKDNQIYIEGNQVLRAEHDKTVADYEQMLSVERQDKQDLILVRDKLASIKRKRWGFSVGIQGGVSFSGHPYAGFGGQWGYQF